MDFVKFLSDLPWYWDKTVSLALSIVQSLLIAGLTFLIVNNAFAKKQKIGASLNKEGVQRVTSNDGRLTNNDVNLLFGKGNNPKPTEIKLCYITGYGFLRVFQKDIINVIKAGCNVKILVASPKTSYFFDRYHKGESIFVDDLVEYYSKAAFDKTKYHSFLEKEDFMMALSGRNLDNLNEHEVKKIFKEFFTEHQDGDNVGQIFKIIKLVDMLSNSVKDIDGAGNIELRFYEDEYRMPITLAKFDRYKKKPAHTVLWTNITAPIDETRDSISLYFQKYDSDSGKFVDSIDTYFDYLWDCYKS